MSIAPHTAQHAQRSSRSSLTGTWSLVENLNASGYLRLSVVVDVMPWVCSHHMRVRSPIWVHMGSAPQASVDRTAMFSERLMRKRSAGLKKM